MRLNGSELNSSVLPRDPPAEGSPRRQPWVTSTLAAILIFTIVVDLLGNLLVVLSVYRNKKLRNAGDLGLHFCVLRGWVARKYLTQGREVVEDQVVAQIQGSYKI